MRTFENTLIGRVTPWLRRTVGGPIMRGLGAPLDALAALSREAIKARFPDATREDALAVIGKERRIRRGPIEDATTYASRLAPWLDDHRTRGGPYALARQLYLFWKTALGADFEIVYYSGRRFSVDGATGVVAMDDWTWSLGTADESGNGAQFWIFFHVTGLSAILVDETGAEFVTDGGATILADILAGGALTDAEAEEFRCVPREWNAAHVSKITIVLLYGTGRLWDYPDPPTYTTWASTSTWGEPDPAIVTVED